jgi:hypothetical protein
MKTTKDPLDVVSIVGMVGALLVIISGFILHFIYQFGEGTPKDGIGAVFSLGIGYFLLTLGQIGWYGRRLMRLEQEVKSLRGKERPE